MDPKRVDEYIETMRILAVLANRQAAEDQAKQDAPTARHWRARASEFIKRAEEADLLLRRQGGQE